MFDRTILTIGELVRKHKAKAAALAIGAASAVAVASPPAPPDLPAFNPPISFSSIGSSVATIIGQALLVIIPIVIGVALTFMVVRKLRNPGSV